jgi:hypothetical protein
MEDTPEHGYNLPSKETTDWHTPLNDNFEKIDSDVAIRDTEANKGEYKPKDGAKYEATDSGAVYYGDGTSWVLSDRKVESLEVDRVVSKPVMVGEAFSDRHEYVGYDDLITAVDEAPSQAEIIINGNVTVTETIAFDGTYLSLRGRGGYNRKNQSGMSSIIAGEGFTGTHLINLNGIGSKWGSIKNINLFCDNVPNGITTGRADNGLIENTAIYGGTGDHCIEIRNGAFDNIINRCYISGRNDTDYCVKLHEPETNHNSGNEPKIINSLIRSYDITGCLIDKIGNVGPRIVNTSFRGGGGGDPADFGIEIRNSGNTRHIVIDRCQFENHSTAIKYTGNGGAYAHAQIARCTFVGFTGQKGIKTSGRVGNLLIGPFNWFGAPADLNGRSGSQRIATFFNYSSSDGDPITAGGFKNDITRFEPFLGTFKMGGAQTLEFGQTKGGSDRAVRLRQNYVEVTENNQENLFQSQSNNGSFTVINRGTEEIGEFFNTKSVSIKSQSGAEYTTSYGTDNHTNIYRENRRVKIENRVGDGRYTVISREGHHR